MNKEEILDKHLWNKFDDFDRQQFLSAMDEYAKQAFEAARLFDNGDTQFKYPTFEDYQKQNH